MANVTNTVDGSGRKRTDVFAMDLAAWRVIVSLIRTILEKWREQKSIWAGFKREWEVRN